jgi:hypothetical protein
MEIGKRYSHSSVAPALAICCISQSHAPMEFAAKWRQRVPSMRMNKFIIQHGVITHSDIICIRLHLDRDPKIVSELSSFKKISTVLVNTRRL